MAQPLPAKSQVIFNGGPYDPWSKTGDPDDTAYYVRQPGEGFLRPWLAIEGGIAFLWPLGIEGFSLSVEPTLGIHKYIGDNHVKIDVMHLGEERISLSGSFPGVTAKDAMQALYKVVKAKTPDNGKLLYLPFVLDYTRRVTVASFRTDRSEDMRGEDLTYSIDFVVSDFGPEAPAEVTNDDIVDQQGSPPNTSGSTSRRFTVTSKYNTLRKIASLKKVGWESIYNKNRVYFDKNLIPMYAAPNAPIKLGTKLYY